MCNWWCYRSLLPLNFWELTKWWFLLVVFINVVVHISQLLFLFITFYLEAKSTKKDGKDIELETRNNNQEEDGETKIEEEEMEVENTNSSSSSPSLTQLYNNINNCLSVLNMISNLSVIIFLTIYLLIPSAMEWLPHYSVAIVISFFWMFSFFFIFVLPPVKYQTHIEYFKLNKHFHYSELSLFLQWKETINEFGRTYYLSYLSQLSQSFHRNKAIIVLISLFALILFSFFLSFAVSGLCITIEPTTISTRLTRMMNEDVCDGKSGICHLYLLLPAEDSIHNMKVILHTNKEPTMPIVEYGFDPSSLSSSSNGEYTYMKDIKEADRFVSSFLLTGLISDTVYYFSVRYDDQEDHGSDVRMFKTLTNNSSFSFIAGGDIGATNASSIMAKLAGKEAPSFVTFGGDIAYENGFPACYQRYDDVLSLLETNLITPDQLMIPLAFAIGNHDVSGELTVEPHPASLSPFFFDYFPHYPSSLTPPIKEQEAYHYHIIGERSMLIILDSNHCNSPGGDQAIWLEEVLIKNKNYTFFTQYHVPMYPCNDPFNDTISVMLRDSWLPLFDSYGVAVSLENHGHSYKRTFPLFNNTVSREGTVYIGDGAFGVYPIYPPVPFNATVDWWLNFTTPANNFIQLTVEEGAIRMAAKTSDGSILDHSDIYLPTLL